MLVDILLVPMSLYAAFSLRYGNFTPLDGQSSSLALFPMLTVVGLGVAYGFRLDRIKLSSLETDAVYRIGIVAGILTASAIVLSYLFKLEAPRSVPLIFGVMFFVMAVGVRLSAFALLRKLYDAGGDSQRVAIYGAGAAGMQLASALRQSKEAQPMFFVDDNPSLRGLMISGLRVYDPCSLEAKLKKHKVEQILLAVPSMPKARRTELVEGLKPLPAEVKVLPSYIELMAGNGTVDALKRVSPDQLLCRDKVDLDIPEITRAYAGRVVMVAGAGGSIGSELCRQLLDCNPTRIVLFEQSEYQLYSIDQELKSLARMAGITITPRLGSVTNKPRVSTVIAEEGVEIILHAAAYKHVPMVEENELEGARNNVLGTQVVAAAAADAKIERFVLISTDKAARPTNIMGATKRLAELVIQDIQTRSPQTKFALVRFGNVLGSSGSMLPLFQRQIAQGGPVTVPHGEVTRFFRTIPEAARLVLLAGAYVKGGDVFVLDMGKPQKIIDIARQMISLCGRTVKNCETGQGDIAIEITGLRPGEKLHEEPLIDDKSLVATPHPKILRAEEAMLSEIEVASMLRELQRSIERGDPEMLRDLIEAKVEGYHIQEEEISAS